MKITRLVDGFDREFELTPQEMREAYDTMKRNYLEEDVRARLEENEIDDVSEIDIEFIVNMAERTIDYNDGYWDYYWECIQYAIDGSLNRQ